MFFAPRKLLSKYRASPAGPHATRKSVSAHDPMCSPARVFANAAKSEGIRVGTGSVFPSRSPVQNLGSAVGSKLHPQIVIRFPSGCQIADITSICFAIV